LSADGANDDIPEVLPIRESQQRIARRGNPSSNSRLGRRVWLCLSAVIVGLFLFAGYRLWPVAFGISESRRFDGHQLPVDALEFSPDGRYVLSGGRDDAMRLWDIHTGEEVRHFDGQASPVRCMAFSSDGSRMASGCGDRHLATGKPPGFTDCTVGLWDVATGQELSRFGGHTDQVNTVAFSPDGRYLASAGADGSLCLLDGNTLHEVRRLAEGGPVIRCSLFSPDGLRLLSGDGSGVIREWDVLTGGEVRQFQAQCGKVSSLAFSPDGRWLLSGHDGLRVEKRMVGLAEQNRLHLDDCSVRLWEMENGQEVRRFPAEMSVIDVAFSPDGRQILAILGKGIVLFLDAERGVVLRRVQLSHAGSTCRVAYLPQGPCALVTGGGFEGTVHLYTFSN
jgi:WD40 repeat protein